MQVFRGDLALLLSAETRPKPNTQQALVPERVQTCDRADRLHSDHEMNYVYLKI